MGYKLILSKTLLRLHKIFYTPSAASSQPRSADFRSSQVAGRGTCGLRRAACDREGRLAPFADRRLVRLDLLGREAGGEDEVAAGRVEDHLEGLGDGAGLRGVGDGDLADEQIGRAHV